MSKTSKISRNKLKVAQKVLFTLCLLNISNIFQAQIDKSECIDKKVEVFREYVAVMCAAV